MSDQNGGKTEADEAESKPASASEEPPESVSSANRTPPVIEGEAVETSPAAEQEVAAEGEPPAAEAPKTPEASPRKSSALRPVVILIGAVALGGGAYYLSNAGSTPTPKKLAETATPIVVPEKPLPPRAPEPAPTAEAEKPAPVAPAADELKAPDSPKSLDLPKAADLPKPADLPKRVEAPAPVAPTAEPAPASAETDKAVAEMAGKLAAAQATVESLSARLKAVEGQLAAPKDSARATVAARDAGSSAGDAAARVVVAQSLLTALRQGDDFSVQLAALQKFGADPASLAPIRAGLAAPTLSRLAADFAALAPKLIAAATPPEPAPEAKSAKTSNDSTLARLADEARNLARRLVRIRPAGAPDQSAAALQVEKIGKDLRAGDLAAALADRQQLPAPALALSADWATAAQNRLDAEAAAKAELAEALKNLTKAKS